jgi:hypothetical protein
VEIATFCSLEIELSCRRHDSYTRLYPYQPEDSRTYKKLGDQKRKGVELDRQDNTISPGPNREYIPLDPSEKRYQVEGLSSQRKAHLMYKKPSIGITKLLPEIDKFLGLANPGKALRFVWNSGNTFKVEVLGMDLVHS